MQAAMAANKPNSGTRPPNLTLASNEHRACLTCDHFNGAGLCKLYQYKVQPDQVCDSWAPQPN